MDFPASLVTNLYRNVGYPRVPVFLRSSISQKKIDRIQWSQWTLRHHPRSQPVKVLPNVLFDLNILQVLEKLRSHGFHACFDHEQHIVWLFTLSEKAWGSVEKPALFDEVSCASSARFLFSCADCNFQSCQRDLYLQTI